MICTLKDYRRITKDGNSYDGDVLDALVDAQNTVEQKTERFFDSAERTEKLSRYLDGRVYPRATPITSVSVPSGAVIDGNSVKSNTWQYMDVATNWAFSDETLGYPMVEVTYVGGYAPGAIPAPIVKVTAEIAKLSLNPSVIPAGATSIQVGDVAITGSAIGVAELPASVERTLRAWRKRDI